MAQLMDRQHRNVWMYDMYVLHKWFIDPIHPVIRLVGFPLWTMKNELRLHLTLVYRNLMVSEKNTLESRSRMEAKSVAVRFLFVKGFGS